MSGVTEMLIPAASQPSPHCLSGLSPKPKIVLVPIKAFHFQHCRGFLRPLLLNCNKKAKPGIEWRWGNHILLCGRKNEGMKSQTRCILAAVALSPIEADATFSTINAADCRGAALSASNITSNDSRWVGMSAPSSLSSSGSFNVAFTISPPEEGSLPSSLRKHNLELLMGTAQNRASRTIAKTVGVSIEMGMLATEEAEKKRREEIEMLRRKKISEANKGRAPWNKGKKGVSKSLDGGSATRLTDNELISPEEREHLRRQRISNANRGKIPWNKGKQHSQETKQRIRVRVIEAMKDPKIREKLRVQAEVVKLSPEIRLRIKTGIINAWNVKKRIKARQEICLVDWKEMIAEAARKGYEGDVVYQWDSHDTIKEQLRSAWQPPPLKRREVVSRGDLSTEHRRRISEAIKAKWADPNYRISVEKGIHDSLVKRGLASNVTSKKSNAIRPPKRKKPLIKVTTHDDAGIQKNPVTLVKEQPVFPKPTVELPAYKDPQSEKKLEKLKWMRDRRLSAEEQKRREITERARVLIAQAEKAAKALEAAAVKDKNALAPLLETRRLLAEAVRSFETTSLGRHLSKDAALWGGDGDLVVSRDVLNTAAALSSPSRKGDGKGS